MISKELLSEVLGSKVRSIEIINSSVTYTLCHSVIGYVYINIYELAHKCKEWATKQKYSFNICYRDDWWDRLEKRVHIDFYNNSKSFQSDTEPEAIFKASQWILENKTIN